MLTYLHVKNIALIDEVALTLHDHLNIFTGETGAGKSMLIESIQFAIGNRTSKQIIRRGQECAYVKLAFQDTKGMGRDYIEENGFPYDEKSKIEIERTLYLSGRTVYKINGVTCTRQMVKELAALMIDVHGQHEPQSLLDVTKHIYMLDSFGNDVFLNLKKQYKEAYEKWLSIKEELAQIGTDDRKRLQLRDMLTFQAQEIGEANLKVDEEELLKEQYEVLSHAEKIMVQCQRAYDFLEQNSGQEIGAAVLIGKASKSLQDISEISNELKALHEQVLSIEAQLQDVSYEMRRYTDGIEYSPEALIEVQDRLDVIYKLKQKYGSSIKEILAYKETCEKELSEMEYNEANKEELGKALILLEKELKERTKELTKERYAIAERIQEEIDGHLHDLQMPYAKFEVALKESNHFNKLGKDEVEFMICTNLGEDMHPLCKIASGGEISRVMLAIKTVLVLGDVIETVIFDEIDTGISGLAAQKVAEKLAAISRVRQVICITHLSQIAAMGDRNYLIEKKTQNEMTQTILTKMNEAQIYEELCRLMGGLVTESTLQSAKEIKYLASSYKEGVS